MKLSNAKTRLGAIAFATVALCGAAILLIEDVIRDRTFTVTHLLSLLTLAMAVGSLHYAHGATKAKRWGKAAMLVILALTASGLVMLGTAGRNSDLTTAKVGKINDVNRKLAAIDADRAGGRKNAITRASPRSGPLCFLRLNVALRAGQKRQAR